MSSISFINPKNLGEIEDEFEYSTLDELAAAISTYSWAPGLFAQRRRTIGNLLRLDLMVLDVDSGATLTEAQEKFKDYKHIIATSRNHQKEKNGVTCDRFRVILFLDSPIKVDRDFKATWNRAQRLWPFIDQACKDSSRFFYASPGIVSINRDGREFNVSVELVELGEAGTRSLGESESRLQQLGTTNQTNVESVGQPKGTLWKSTLEFLIEGAQAGTRHTKLVQAVGNMREQGYSKPEVIEKIENMINTGGSWTQDHLSAVDLKTIDRMYERNLKYPFQPKESEKNWSSIIVNANELLGETFSYLADKDKVAGEPTGIDGLDRLLGGGFRTGELTVLMAQAKTGKNTLYHHLIYKHLERGLPFGYASRELNPATEVIPNLLSIAMKCNAWRASINATFQTEARQAVSRWELYFAPGYGHFAIDEMETWFRQLRDLGVTHFLFDHFHYALLTEDYESTATLIKRLKSITKELDIHLSLIVQPRSLREGEQLSLATLRGGAAIGQALDNLLILERVKNDTNVSRLTLEVARHKLAKLGDLYLRYDAETTSFVELSRDTVVEPANVPKALHGDMSKRPWNRGPLS